MRWFALITAVLFSVMVVRPGSAQKPHWAYQPITRPRPPQLRDSTVSRRSAIDAFILARLKQAKLSPSQEADPATLLRRVTIDLTGLPPSPQDVAEFVQDTSPGSYERLVERLLASPHYGERWARLWLDLCHYADSDGYLTDQLRPVAWRYRQWLVNALNHNLPFDQFTVQQLAGDLLPETTVKQKLATGFLRQTLSNREGGADPEEYRTYQVVDRTNLVATTWLALTLGCAQCHDHKYDRISQREYYRHYGFFNNADEVNVNAPLPDETVAYTRAWPTYVKKRDTLIRSKGKGLERLLRRWEAKLLHAYRFPGEDAHWDRQWELLGLVWGGGKGEGQLEGWEIVKLPWSRRTAQQRADLLDYFFRIDGGIDPVEFKRLNLAELRSQLNKLKAGLPLVTRAPVMRASQTHRRTHLHIRGDFRDRGERLTPATLRVLPPIQRSTAKPRLDFARWLVDRKNPLTARVVVNRMWQAFFGRGLVATPDDFGIRGSLPSHPRLLDWLATEFVKSGWDVKAMHRLIVTSATYRQSSVVRRDLQSIDPDNVLLARQNSVRISAEMVRDLALAAAGLWDRRIGGPSVKPAQSPRVTDEAFGNHTWKASPGGDGYRRGLYTFVIRTAPFAQAAIFDAPNPTSPCVQRERSNTALQALTLLNDPVFHEAARHLGRRLQLAGVGAGHRIQTGFRICLSRNPTAVESQAVLDYVRRYTKQLTTRGLKPTELNDKVWTGVASIMLNLHEFITRD